MCHYRVWILVINYNSIIKTRIRNVVDIGKIINSEGYGWDKMDGDLSKVLIESEYIPDTLIKYIGRCIDQGKSNRLIDYLYSNPIQCVLNVSNTIKNASMITGLTTNELFHRIDFSNRDIDPTRIDAAFAELRAISYLNNEGFGNINPLRAGERKSVDIVALREKNVYAIEVTTSSFWIKKDRWREEELCKWLVDKLLNQKKIIQIQGTKQELKCNKGVLIAVIDNYDAVALNTRNSYKKIAKEVWNRCGKDEGLHICLVTGRQSFEGLDDINYPKW
jgi:hypothetical protein